MADGYISQITLPNNNTYLLKDSEKISAINASGTAPLTLSSTKSGTTYTLTGSVADASASASGVVNTDAQTFSGVKTFDNGLHIYGTISTQGTGSAAGTMYPGGAYHSGHNSIILHGDTAGISGIGFTSEKATKSGTTTNINGSSDRAFIQYHAYGVTPAAEGTAPTLATSGELGTLVIGVGNDATDTIRLQAPGNAGILHQIGATAYPIPHTTNTNGSVGGTTTPVYVEAGVIKAGTALGTASQKAESYFAKASHNHTASDINSGTFDVARIPNSILKWQTTTAESTTLYDFGVYVNMNNANGSSMNGGNYFNILNVPYRKASGNTKADWGWQLGNTTSNDGRLWYRTSGDNVWGDWQTIAHATQSTSDTGSSSQPVYMTKTGVITAITAVGAAYGGTGKTTLKDSANALINALDTGSSPLTANDYVITQYVGGGTTTTTYHRRPASQVVNSTLVKAALGTVGTTAKKFLKDTGAWTQVAFSDLSGTATNAQLANSKVTIAGNDVSLGGSLSDSTLRESLGLSKALRFIGVTTTDMTGGTATNHSWTGTPAGISNYTPKQGDVVINNTKQDEWVCTSVSGTTYTWERLGSDTSYKIVQSAVSDPTASTATSTTFIDTISQNANGVITATKKTLPTASSTVAGITKVGASGGAAAYSHTHSYLANTNKGAADRPIYITGNAAAETTYRMAGTNVDATAGLTYSNDLDTGIWYVNGISGTDKTTLYNQSDGVIIANKYSTSWISEIYQDYRTGQLAIRGKNNGTWAAWRNVLDSTNYTNYAVAKTAGVTAVTWNATNKALTCTINGTTANVMTAAQISTALGLGTIATKADNDYMKFGGDDTGLGASSPAATAKTYWADATKVSDNMITGYYNHSGTEYSLLFSKRSTYGSILKWGYGDKYLRILRIQSGSWKSDDWEKIDAGYADSAGTATSAGKWTTARTLTIGNKGQSVDGSGNVSWSLTDIGAAARNHEHDYIGNSRYIAYTADGHYEGSGTVTGYIKIKIPKTKSATMLSFDVDIYNYSGDTSTRYHIAGYNYVDASWNNTTAYCIAPLSNAKANLTVRFLSNGDDEMYVTIGETDTSWSYPKVNVHNIVMGHSGNSLDNWASGWTITITNAAFTSGQLKVTKTNTNIAYTSITEGTSTLAWNEEKTLYTIGNAVIKAKLPAKPSYSDIGAAPASTVSCTTANVQSALGINTSSGSTSKALTEKGTWATFLTGHSNGYGKITSGAISTTTTSITTNTATIEANSANEKLTIKAGNKWIQTGVTNSNTAGSDVITLGHFVPASAISNLSTTAQTPAFGNTFNIPTINLDEAGHVTSVSNTTVKIPELPSSMTPSAHTHGNISNTGTLGTTASYGVATDANKKIIAIDLTVNDPAASGNATTFVTSVTQSSQGKISVSRSTVPNASSTTAGIVKLGADGGAATYGHTHSGYLTAHGKSYGGIQVSAQSTTSVALTSSSAATTVTAVGANETVKFVTKNKWIVIKGVNSATAGADEVQFAHITGLTAKTSYCSTSATASANGGKITVTDIQYDEAGHITSTTDRTITLSQTTYSLSSLGAASSTHTHGNISNTGTISTSAAPVNGDAIVISTSANGGLVKKTNITFDGSTTSSYLNKKGDWGTPPDTKNTAGSTATATKIFLIGATAQSASPQTYSTTFVYATDGVMSAEAFGINHATTANKVTLQWNNTDSSLDFVFA